MVNPTINEAADNSQSSSSYESIAKELGMEEGQSAEPTTAKLGTESQSATEGEDDIPEAFRTPKEGEKKEEPSGDKDPLEGEIEDALKEIDDENLRGQKEKGVRKLVDKLQAERAEIQAEREAAATLYSYADSFANPETAREAYEQLGRQLAEVHKWGDAPVAAAVQIETEPDTGSKYGLEFPSDDKVVDIVLQKVGEILDQKITPFTKEVQPLIESRKMEERKAQALANAEKHEATVQSKFGDWMTKEMIAQAITENPNMSIEKAIYASHGEAITRKAVEYAQKGRGKASLTNAAVASREGGKESTGKSYIDIFHEHGIDPDAVRTIF
jgi:hypothetical protein